MQWRRRLAGPCSVFGVVGFGCRWTAIPPRLWSCLGFSSRRSSRSAVENESSPLRLSRSSSSSVSHSRQRAVQRQTHCQQKHVTLLHSVGDPCSPPTPATPDRRATARALRRFGSHCVSARQLCRYGGSARVRAAQTNPPRSRWKAAAKGRQQ